MTRCSEYERTIRDDDAAADRGGEYVSDVRGGWYFQPRDLCGTCVACAALEQICDEMNRLTSSPHGQTDVGFGELLVLEKEAQTLGRIIRLRRQAETAADGETHVRK